MTTYMDTLLSSLMTTNGSTVKSKENCDYHDHATFRFEKIQLAHEKKLEKILEFVTENFSNKTLKELELNPNHEFLSIATDDPC